MYLHFILILCLSVCGLCSALFLLKDKGKPLIYCYKICPLYCSKHATRTKRYDQDASFLTYLHDNPYASAEVLEKIDFAYWNSKTTKTTKPTTTTEKPKYLDYNPYFVDDGSGDFDHFPPNHYPHHFEHLTETTTTTKKPTTEAPKTREPVYLDHNPYHLDVPDDYDYYPSPHFYWKPKPTTTTTTTTTTEKPFYIEHNPYFIWPDYDYHPIHYGWKPKPTTTVAPTTTEEPTFICQVCIEKCGNKFS